MQEYEHICSSAMWQPGHEITFNQNIILYNVFAKDAIFEPGHLWQIQKI